MSLENNTVELRERDFCLEIRPEDVQFGGDAKSAEGTRRRNIKLIARTDQAVDTWFGKIVHDMSGLQARDKLPLDWRHDSDHVIGYVEKFDTKNGCLECDGTLVSLKEGDRADTIMKQADEGIPFESSIFFNAENAGLEKVPAEKNVKVNGKQFTGPGIVIRDWKLRGIALCPYGRDSDTEVKFSLDEIIPSFKENKMADDVKKDDVVEGELEDKQPVDDKKVKKDDKPNVPLSSEGLTGQDYIEAFGDDGAVWFAEGKSFGEAALEYIAELEAKVEELEGIVESLDLGGDDALDADDADGDKDKAERLSKMALKLGPSLAKVAAGMKFAGK